ncbi:MAG TPA: twin-arginine translocase TatA/TatE family subunit [Desulfobacterales bacterium]|nr:MAG: preprotein translocase subunit TatB [Deltaproteobacteria bacterium]HGY11410.1 twin-arginine translocase TatA/TatE family subunit [Desulfobacterales bacterium]
MFGLGMPEILMILAIALIVIGPKKLPDLAKTLGRAMGEFKRSAQDFKRSIDVETTVKDIKDVADPKVDLEGIIKDANFKDETDTDSKGEETAGSDDSDLDDSSSDDAGKETPDNYTDDIKADTEPDFESDIESDKTDTTNLKP